MSKKLETLEKLISFAFVMSENMIGLTKGNYDESQFIKKTYDYLRKYNVDTKSQLELEDSLKRLEQIDNANPSEALYELNRIDCNITYLLSDCDINEEVSMNFNSIRDNKSCEIIKQALINAQREHKLLEIVKEKVMNLVSVSDGRVWDGELYQSNKLSEEESVLLKGWKNE